MQDIFQFSMHKNCLYLRILNRLWMTFNFLCQKILDVQFSRKNVLNFLCKKNVQFSVLETA